METKILQKSCQTCLFMATHENCDGCLGNDVDNFQYLHYQEGNWMKRIMQYELDGRRNIVIGGQGEAEVNTQWTLQQTADSLHNVAEQCGYFVQGPTTDDNDSHLSIATSEGIFRLIWDKDGGFQSIYACNHDWQSVKKIWDKKEIEQYIAGMPD